MHHSAEQLDFLVNTRLHPIDLVWSRMIMLTPIFALGLANPVRFSDGLIAATILLSGSMWGYFIHSNVRWRLGPLRRRAHMHRICRMTVTRTSAEAAEGRR